MQQLNLNQFIKSDYSSLWIKEPYMDIYMRNSPVYIEGRKQNSLCISSVTVSIKKRGKQLFRRFLSRAVLQATRANFDTIYVENVHDPRFQMFFAHKPTWHKFGDFQFPSYYKDLRRLKK